MADKKITQLQDIGVNIASDDILHVIDDPSGNPINKKVSVQNLFGNVPNDVSVTGNVTATGTVSVGNIIYGTESITTTGGTTSYTLDVNKLVSIIDTTTEAADLIIPDGTSAGQIKIVVITKSSGAQLGTLTEASNVNLNVVGGNTITLTNDGESVSLIWTGFKWINTSTTGIIS